MALNPPYLIHSARPDEPGDGAWDIPALPGEPAALEALVCTWGEAYHIGCDEGQWWFRRRDGKSATETASTPDCLLAKIVTDYIIYPVRCQPHSGGTAPSPSGQPASTGHRRS